MFHSFDCLYYCNKPAKKKRSALCNIPRKDIKTIRVRCNRMESLPAKQINRRCAFPAVRIYCAKASSQEELLTAENGEETDAGMNE
ncbi:unnamed protein product [Sphagnum tenellum]